MTLDTVNQWMKNNREGNGFCAERITCGNGLSFSAQVGPTHYCSPRAGDAYPYSRVEVGFPSRMVPEFMEWAEEAARPTETVYGYVPTEVVNAVIAANGGISVANAGEGA